MSPVAGATAEYAESAEELVQELVRVFKIGRLYGRDHPQRAEVEETAVDRIGRLLDAHGTIELKVEEDALVAEDQVIYQPERSRESLPQILHREGIRQLAFYSGLTLQEVRGFVENLANAARDDRDAEGLIGKLWEENFYHLRYAFVERLQDEEWIPPSAEAGEAGVEQGRVELEEEDAAAGQEAVRRLREFDSTLYFLDDEDMATLQAEIEAEKSRTLVHEALTLLRELLMHPVSDDPTIVLGALSDMHAGLLEDGNYADVQKLHQLFIPYLESDGADQRGREALARLRGDALSEETLARLATRLEGGIVEERVAAAYYRTFGQDDPIGLLTRAGDLKRLCQRTPIASAFAELAREHHEAVLEALSSDDPRTVGAATVLAAQVADPRLLEGVARALDSEDPTVRRDAIQALKQFGGGPALQHVARVVDDPDPGVRVYALRHLITHRYAPALPAVERVVESDEWTERSPTEQRLVFEAYGALGGESVLQDLAGRLGRRGGLFRKADPEEMACALVGLGAIGTDAAREVVERARANRNPLVSRTAEQVLASWGEPPAEEG